ncbi:MAG TPA: DUF6582 domain-containing protein [Candidatus Acidoferrales bacterium]|nr:DUF6582 domain-containing protein [Candidatus Acidoferrales bacterium]
MTDLREKQRKSMNKDVFAYVDKNGEGHLPLNDESHVRNAMARFNQTAFPSVTAKESARRKVLAAARKHGIAVSKDDNIKKPSHRLQSVKTKRGLRGGRKVVRAKR